MAEKSYLKNQIKLISLNATDTFTEDEYDLYKQIIDLVNEINKLDSSKDAQDVLRKKALIAKKKILAANLSKLVSEHRGYPRKVRLESVIHHSEDEELPSGVTWNNLKLSKKIAEFESEMSRAMGLHANDCTFDKIIIKWKSLDLLEQLVTDGFTMDILADDGRILQKKYKFFTASAGQLRRDKIQCISEDIWKEIKDRIECGLDWNTINARGGTNVNKLLAYYALCGSATDPWLDFDIDRCIVIPDWKGKVTDRMMYIKPDYTAEIAVKTVIINHVDGAGMMLPCVSRKNFMFRGPFFKGLLTSFDFMKFCEVNGVEPVIKDFWGKEHNLKEENILILFTDSQFKLAKLYKSWDEYKDAFKKCHCQFGKTQYEEDYIPDKKLNYQMTQTLYDFTDEEIKKYTEKTHKKIESVGNSKETMLETLDAKLNSHFADKVALALYPELLRDGYNRQQLKDVRKKMLMDAKSGAIKCQNKRLFAIPDWYAACEYYFLHVDRPVGLLANGEIACVPFRNREKADVLRSPHLYMEHAIRKIVHDPNIYDWFYTDGVYTSCHDLISRILQFDVDGDQLNVVVEEVIVNVAERNVQEFDVVPLFYDADKAPSELISKQSQFNGLKRAHEYSNIGEISNMLTKLWNRDEPDRMAAALLTYLNNLRIDGAKTGMVNEYTNYPEVAKQINKATGGVNGRLPYFFQYSKNGRRDLTTNKKKRKWAKQNDSTMNRLCRAFDDIKNINMNWAGIPPFNWQMLMTGPCMENREDIVEEFCELDKIKKSFAIEANDESPNEYENVDRYSILVEHIAHTLISKYGSLEYCYPFIVKHLFTGENEGKSFHKQTFWQLFGDIAVKTLKENLANCYTCNKCGAKVPNWVETHVCIKGGKGFFECIDCHKLTERVNPKQCRCATCQEEHRRKAKNKSKQDRREQRKGEKRSFTSWQYQSRKT